MKKQQTLLLTILIGLSINSSTAQTWGWMKYPGCDVAWFSGADGGTGVVVDQQGDVYNCGYFKNTAYFDSDSVVSAGKKDIYIARYNNAGNLQWLRNFGGDDDEQGTKIQIDSTGNIYVLCSYQGTFNVGSTTLPAADSTVINQGGFFIVKLDNAGNIIWVNSYATEDVGFDEGELKVDKSGNIYLFNFFPNSQNTLKKFDTNGSIMWEQDSLEVESSTIWMGLCLDSIGNIFATGRVMNPSFTAYDSYIAKVNSSGDIIFKKIFNNTPLSSSGACFNAITVDHSGNIFLSGNLRGNFTFAGNTFTSSGLKDLFVAKLDSQANAVWGFSGGGSIDENSYALTIDNANNIIVQGEYSSRSAIFGNDTLNNSSPTQYNTVILKFSNSGSLQWVESSGYDTLDDRVIDMAIDNNNNIYLTGSIELYGTNNYFGNTLIIANVNNNTNILLTLFNSTTTTGINNIPFGKAQLKIYPNPITNQFTVFGTQAKGEMVIYNSLGNMIKREVTEDQETKIQTSDWTSGIYLVHYTSQNFTANFKLMKF
ncbi:MAG TPA: T9SS type A sorting domain-containing protein [Niabella sp.]|nr:T9SS type A sorting domain-containing protein [Niabella sp.]